MRLGTELRKNVCFIPPLFHSTVFEGYLGICLTLLLALITPEFCERVHGGPAPERLTDHGTLERIPRPPSSHRDNRLACLVDDVLL